jgi:hypothetical protein
MAAVAPDYVEPCVGWRVWSVVEHAGDLRLASLVYHVVWPLRKGVRAGCRRPLAALPWGRMPLHGAPDVHCCCGIHAVATVEDARPYLRCPLDESVRGLHRVIGTVALWGRVVEGPQGWRAGLGYPEHLYVPAPRRRLFLPRGRPLARVDDIARALEAYGVPVELVDERARTAA